MASANYDRCGSWCAHAGHGRNLQDGNAPIDGDYGVTGLGLARELMRLQVGALFTQSSRGRLLGANVPSGGPAPRFFLGRTSDGNLCWLGRDIDDELAAELEALCEAERTGFETEPHSNRDRPFIDRLSREAPTTRIWAGPVFVVPANVPGSSTAVRVIPDNIAVLSPYLEAWREDVAAGTPTAAVITGDNAVSVCASVRITARAHEAGVETHPDFRRLGHAAQAVAAWANMVRERGGVPLYSTSWSNRPSRGLARKLRLVQFGSDLHIT